MASDLELPTQDFLGDPAQATHFNAVVCALLAGMLLGPVVTVLFIPVLFAPLEGWGGFEDWAEGIVDGFAHIGVLVPWWGLAVGFASPFWAVMHHRGFRGWASAVSLGVGLSFATLAGLIALVLTAAPGVIELWPLILMGLAGISFIGGAIGLTLWFVAYRLAPWIPKNPRAPA